MKTQPWAVVSIAAVVFFAAGRASAQTEPRRLEVGGHFSTLRIGDAGNTNAGVGGRVSYELTRWLAVDGEIGFFPNDRLDIGSSVLPVTMGLSYSRRRLEGFAGPKIGWRGERFGAFAKVRPGFTRLTDRGLSCTGEMCALALFVRPEYDAEFAVDIGGILEFYPTPRTTARFDLGTTAIRHDSRNVGTCQTCTTQNFATSLGMGVRF